MPISFMTFCKKFVYIYTLHFLNILFHLSFIFKIYYLQLLNSKQYQTKQTKKDTKIYFLLSY